MSAKKPRKSKTTSTAEPQSTTDTSESPQQVSGSSQAEVPKAEVVKNFEQALALFCSLFNDNALLRGTSVDEFVEYLFHTLVLESPDNFFEVREKPQLRILGPMQQAVETAMKENLKLNPLQQYVQERMKK